MVASLAHQIRTPLSAAMLYAANLSNNTLSKEARGQFAEKLLSRLRDLESQVNDMLLFAKSGADQVVAEISMQSLMTEVQAASEVMLSRQQASMNLTLPEPDVIILGNKTALVGALQNLIHNALEIKPKNAQIGLSAARDPEDPEWMNLCVTDNGPGIPSDKLEKIFEPFYTTRSQGTGLGLAVVKTVAQSHHGKVSVCNLADGGACFILRLPIVRAQASKLTQFDNATLQQTQPTYANVARS
jgi:two-component system sensor histidine kinase FlrB